MKRFILMIVVAIAMAVNAQAAKVPTDTLSINTTKVSQWIEKETPNSKGGVSRTYYVVYDGYLIKTTKSTFEKVQLAKQYNAKIFLAAVVSKSDKKIQKIIAL